MEHLITSLNLADRWCAAEQSKHDFYDIFSCLSRVCGVAEHPPEALLAVRSLECRLILLSSG